MSLGWRQLVLMTHMAEKWPEGISHRAMINANLPDCTHPTEPVTRSRNGKNVVTNDRTCPCWGGLKSIAAIFKKLVERDMIEKTDAGYILTAMGWRLLDRERRAPVSVESWAHDGLPRTYNIRKSRRKEFQVLYSAPLSDNGDESEEEDTEQTTHDCGCITAGADVIIEACADHRILYERAGLLEAS